ncbi:LuxR C-terminal-related transcriptional regulator [Bacillus sp. CLL-7-23]|uniref:LuxR C-terminal-related transcriptional regulator n=1 Tax=Bacillus changyiensis TaxID=3004103 RepID=A0ABT4X885_9BACI|nr:LuxR C-terminal-related transcriptional regulator [Bacillus changyiensis]MDA7028468.1 LuxR C-terminal-related transcriptional regulator [Bacillus changyiensis]
MNKKEIENILKNYRWMMNSIEVLRESLKDAGEGMTAQYGVEASLPKPKGTTSDPVYKETVRRAKRFNKIKIYEEKVRMLQERINRIIDERESEVLYWLLEGKSYRWIAQHMELSYSHIKRIRDSIVDQLSSDSNGTNGTKETDETNFTNLKSVV